MAEKKYKITKQEIWNNGNLQKVFYYVKVWKSKYLGLKDGWYNVQKTEEDIHGSWKVNVRYTDYTEAEKFINDLKTGNTKDSNIVIYD